MRYFMTNNRLYRMNIVNDNLCSLCKHGVKTLKHLLFEYYKVKYVWTDFQKWWKQVTGNEINLNYNSIVFWCHSSNP